MLIVLIIIIFIKACHANLPSDISNAVNAVPHVPATPAGMPMCSNKTTNGRQQGFGLQFRQPFMDMEMKNQRNLHIIQEPLRQQLFVLHGNELYQIFVSREEKRLSLVGLLGGGVKEEEPLGAQIIFWHNYLLMAVALDEHLDIYQLPEEQLRETAELSRQGKISKEMAPVYEPIQQLTLNGKYQQLFLTSPEQDQILLIVAVNYTKLYGKLRTFDWSNMYFDLIEELTLPPIHVLNVIGSQPKYLVSGRILKHQSKTILNIYEVQMPDKHLRNRQTLTVTSRKVHTFMFRGKNYLISCDRLQKRCNSFRMSDGQFTAFKQRTSEELSFDKFVAGSHFLVGARQNEVLVFVNGKMNCYGSFKTNETDVSSIITYANTGDEHYILLSYKRPFHTLLRMVEVETEGGKQLSSILNDTDLEDMSNLRKHQHIFEDTIGQLRSLLLRRKRAMDVFRNVASFMSPKLTNLKVHYSVRVHAGKIGLVKVVGKNLRSPAQLLKRVEEMDLKYRRTRFIRDTHKSSNFSLKMPQHLKVQQLHVRNLIYNGSIIEGIYLENSTKHTPILSIRRPISAKTLNTHGLLTRALLRGTRQSSAAASANDLATFKAHELIVQRINNVSVEEFFNSLFMKNRDTKVRGRLVLQAETSVVNMWTPLLNGLVVAQLFNLKQPQIVNSKMLVKGIYVTHLQAQRVNGLNFVEDVVFNGRDDTVETPVEMQRLSIAGVLLLAYTAKVARAVVQDSQLQQFYTGKVIINGSLTLSNLELNDMANSVILVGGLPFSETILKQNYLLQNTPQFFGQPVEFGNAKVTTPAFSTNYLSGHPTAHHLLTTGHSGLYMRLLLIFMQATAVADISCPQYKSKVLELNKDAVRFGEIANITGSKVFTAPLTVDHLMTLHLNSLPVNELVLKSQLEKDFKFGGKKSFDSLVVTDNAYVDEILNCSNLNDLPLEELLNYDYYIDRLYLPHKLLANNVVFHKINGLAFDDVFVKFNVANERLVLHKNLIIEGNVHFDEDLQVEFVNDVHWNAYLQSLVRLNENAMIHGEKQFLNGLVITKELQTTSVNGVNMQDVFNNILSKSKPQLITGLYSFENLYLSNLDVSAINSVPTASFIDTRSPNVIIEGDIIVPRMTVHGDARAKFVNRFQLDGLPMRLQALTNRQWRNLVVLGNAYWNETHLIDKTQHDQLQYLYKNAVRRTGNQVITGNVRMRRPLITRMQTNTPFPQGIDLNYIARDCLLKNTTMPQTVYGHKTLLKRAHMRSVNAQSLVKSNFVNKIDVLRLNASLYRYTSGRSITGPLHFKMTPIVGHLVVEGLVNGMRTENIYHGPNNALPPVKVRSLIVEHDLQVQDINNMSLDYLLENRITLSGDALEVFGFLTFENLVLNKEILLQSINGIPIDNLVFKKSNHLQAITGAKAIDGNLELTGPSHVLKFNGHDLIDCYQHSIFTEGNYHFDSLVIDQGTFTKGLVLISDVLVSEGARTSALADDSQLSNQQDSVIDVMEELQKIDQTFGNETQNQSQHLLYLDFDFNTEVLQKRPNETVDKAHLYNLKHVSMCERQLLQVQKSQLNRRIYLTNITTNFIIANTTSVSVKAQNYCKGWYMKVKSKITVNGKNFSRTFGMNKFIENIEVFTYNETHVFILLHAVDPARNRNEARLLKIDEQHNELVDCQSVRLGVGKIMRLFKFPNYVVLLSVAYVNQRPTVSIYNFEFLTQTFKLTQSIHGDFDIMEVIAIHPDRYHLILSCRKCQEINIYDRDANDFASFFQNYQKVKLKSRIDKIVPFKMGDNSYYFLVLAAQEHDFYHLYKYSHVQGWLPNTFGYFHNIQMAIPLSGEVLESVGNSLLLLLCGGDKGTESDRCSVVKAFGQ